MVNNRLRFDVETISKATLQFQQENYQGCGLM